MHGALFFGIAFCLGSHFLKTPVFGSIFLLFGLAFNFQVPDLGETYVSRNISAWAVICLSLIILWWRPFKQGTIKWSPLWLAGLFLPVIGGLFVLVVNILGNFEHMHMGHYFLPLMLLAFGLFVLGLLQHSDVMPDLSLVIIAIFNRVSAAIWHLSGPRKPAYRPYFTVFWNKNIVGFYQGIGWFWAV